MSHFDRRISARVGAGAAAMCVAGVLTGIAGPAYAEDPFATADLAVRVPGPQIAVDSDGKNVRIDVVNHGAIEATNTKLTLGLADVKDTVTVTLPGEPEGCAISSETVVCDLGNLTFGATGQTVTVLVTPKAGATPGVVGRLTASVASDAPETLLVDNTETVALELVPGSFDLVAYSADVELDQGEVGELAFAVENAGSADVAAIDIAVQLPHFVRFAEQLDHCELAVDDPAVAICHYQGLPAGSGGSDVIPIKLHASAPHKSNAQGSIAAIPAEVAAGVASTATSRPMLNTPDEGAKSLRAEDASPGDDTVAFTVFAGPNSIDLAVTAAPASGKVGDVVGVTFTFTNNGPASGGAGIRVTAPTGTLVLDTPPGDLPDCWTGEGADVDFDFVEAPEMSCAFQSESPPGVTFSTVLKFRITEATVGDDGTIEIIDVVGNPETNPANNIAAIVITTSGDGAGGHGGGLPVTGVQVGVIGAFGAAVIALGAVLLLLARRRPIVTVAPTRETAE